MDTRISQIRSLGRESWAESIGFSDADFLAGAFLDLGLDKGRIAPLVQRYEEAKKAALQQSSLKAPPNFHGYDGLGTWFAMKRDYIKRIWENAVKDILGKYEYVTEDSTRQQIEIPLFYLNSPPVTRSRTVYEEIVTSEAGQSWAITVVGTGMGATQSFGVTDSTKFESQAGDSKLVFIPATILVSLVSTYERGKLVATGLRTEMEEIKPDHWLPGLSSQSDLTGREIPPGLKIHSRRTIPLARDVSTSISSISHSEKAGVQFDVDIGIDLFKLTVKSRIKIRQDHEIRLTFDLPAGHDYELLTVENRSGVWWRIL